jgi:crossover junction endodeoxyribonuclease RuvC
MKFIAFDQSTVKTGFAVMDDTDLVKYGVIDLHKEEDLWIRSQEMFHAIDRLIKDVKPKLIIMEGVALQSNPQVLMKLGQLQGQIMAAAWSRNIPIHIYLPTQWRKIHGFAQGKGIKRNELKIAALNLVHSSYPIEVTEDEAEAISIALAYLKESGKITDDKEK